MVEGYMKQLVNYIKKNLAKGYTLESLKWALINQGYSRTEVERAIKLVNIELAKTAPILREKPVIKIQRQPILEDTSYQEKLKSKSFWQKIKEFFID